MTLPHAVLDVLGKLKLINRHKTSWPHVQYPKSPSAVIKWVSSLYGKLTKLKVNII